MSDPHYQPRERDHLVEPLFGGLGLGDERASEADGDAASAPSSGSGSARAGDAAVAPRAGVLVRLRRWLLGA